MTKSEFKRFLTTQILLFRQIAGSLERSIKTIDNHRQNMLRKTSTKSTGELVAFGINMGFI